STSFTSTSTTTSTSTSVTETSTSTTEACDKSFSDDFNYAPEDPIATKWHVGYSEQDVAWTDGSVCMLKHVSVYARTCAVYDLDAACQGHQQATMDIGLAGPVTTFANHKIIIASDENSGSWDKQPNDCLYAHVGMITGYGQRGLAKRVNGFTTTLASMGGPEGETAWCVRIIQDLSEATEKIQMWDGPDADNLVKRLTANDTACSEADNIHCGLWMETRGSDGTATMTIDNYEVVTP
ncbi:MAG TPA: hypothetical protein VMY35_01575, partial [Phycisphaerae bacterium]|nr:hypothetical protein [Phycisphaerae bacterium]